MIQIATPPRPRRSAIWFLPRALQPFSRRIPLFVTGLLCAAIGGMLWVAHDRVHGVIVDAELGRLQASARQLATTLQSQARRMQRDGVRIGASPALTRVLSSKPSTAEGQAAQKALADERRRAPQATFAVWDRDHNLVLV